MQNSFESAFEKYLTDRSVDVCQENKCESGTSTPKTSTSSSSGKSKEKSRKSDTCKRSTVDTVDTSLNLSKEMGKKQDGSSSLPKKIRHSVSSSPESSERRTTRSQKNTPEGRTTRSRGGSTSLTPPLLLKRNERVGRSKIRSKLRPPSPPTKSDSSDGDESDTPSPVELLLANRPKRQIIPKSLDTTAGLSWREETQLQKALLASLHETKVKSSIMGIQSSEKSIVMEDAPPVTLATIIGRSKSQDQSKTGRENLKLVMPDPDHKPSDSGGQESNGSSNSKHSSSLLYKSHVRAQRKFAQGSRPSSPNVSPVKEANKTPVKSNTSKACLLPMKPTAKTEDFLTFLCLRGTPYLPPHLEFFNSVDSENLVSCPNTPKSSRPATPASALDTPRTKAALSKSRLCESPAPQSRASSPDLDISLDSTELGVKPLTPETAYTKLKASSTSSKHKSQALKRLKQAQVKITKVVSQNAKRKSTDVDDFKMTSLSSSPVKKPKFAAKQLKSPKTLQREKGKMLVKKAKDHAAKMAASAGRGGVMTRRKRQEIEVEQFEQAKAASASNTGSDTMSDNPSSRTRSTRNPAGVWEYDFEDDDLESEDGGFRSGSDSDLSLSSSRQHSKKKKKKKNKRKSDSDDDMIYLYLSYDEKSPVKSPTTRVKKQKLEETLFEGGEQARSRRSRSASVVSVAATTSSPTAAQEGPSEEKVRKVGDSGGKEERSSPKVKQKTKAGASQSIPRAACREFFPAPSDPARVLEAPTYHPSNEQFNDPVTYISSIQQDGEPFGMCRIVPPPGWHPECNIPPDLRFITQNQYVHKMEDRWGPNVKKMECIRQHLESQGLIMKEAPIIGRLELDLPALSAAVAACGGLRSLLDDKKKWGAVADRLNIPGRLRPADRCSKLYDAYCKLLLSYDTLSDDEKSRISGHVEYMWQRQRHAMDTECVTKGQSKSLSEFFQMAGNLQQMFFSHDPSHTEVEDEFWKILRNRDRHICVQYAHVDTENCGSAFPYKSTDPFSKHGWNFNMLQTNPLSVLRHLGPVNGVTIPELHIGMLFSTNCWACDPHALPYITYLHTGADVVWYCVPKSEEEKLKQVLEELNPDLVDPDSPVWLPIDSVMVSPETLQSRGVSVCRTVQRQGEFVVVFPQAYTATVGCGYSIAESIRYATLDWIPLGHQMAEILYESCEGELFSIERLLLKLAESNDTTLDVLRVSLPCLEAIIGNELRLRRKLQLLGLTNTERMQVAVDSTTTATGTKRAPASRAGTSTATMAPASCYDDSAEDEDNRCDVSKKICYLSMVVNEVEEAVYSLEHAVEHVQRKKNLKACKLLHRFDEVELQSILDKVRSKVASVVPAKKKSKHK